MMKKEEDERQKGGKMKSHFFCIKRRGPDSFQDAWILIWISGFSWGNLGIF